MPDEKIRTTRPLNLTSEVILRPSGPLDDDCAVQLREAVAYVAARPGGPIVVDGADVTVVSAAGAATLEWLGDQASHGDRVVTLRHLRPEAERNA